MFGFFKRFGKSKSAPRREVYDYCAVHGELIGNEDIPANGIQLYPYMINRAICPLCLSDWLLKAFPVETKVREVQSSFFGVEIDSSWALTDPPADLGKTSS